MVGLESLTARRLVVVAIAVLVAPTVVAGATHVAGSTNGTATPNETTAEPATNYTVENLRIVTAQGRSPDVYDSPGGIEIINATTNERVWAHQDPRCMRYYDAEPVDNATLLITASCEVDDDGRVRVAMEYDWRVGEIDRIFQIPYDGHDVDKIGPHRYAVADIMDQRAYVVNYTQTGTLDWATFRGQPVRDAWRVEHVWEYNFTEHYPEHAGEEEGYEGDYTHLNDIDSAHNGSAFMLSPRDFNRVMLVNRSTNDVEWTLGDQDDTSILYGQHHPALLTEQPPTVLVGDSLNNRVVEYRYIPESADSENAGEWVRTWVFLARLDGGLNWPRDVHRLPDGNTLVMDTGNNRALEVAPNGTVVWSYETMANPFDIDSYEHGDQPRGPPIHELRGDEASNETATTPVNATGSISPLERYHRIAGFVLPVWVDKWAFLGLVVAAALSLGWGLTEAGLVVRRRYVAE
jgi:hypothetical protein